MNIRKIYFALLLILIVIILSYYFPHPVIYLFLILLLICLLPTILYHIDLIRTGYQYVHYKIGKYDEAKQDACNLLDRHFKIQIIGKQEYEQPVIFTINHSLNDIVSDICLLKIKSKNKIIKVTRKGFVEKLFKNIEHIYIDPTSKNRTEKLLQDVKDAKDNNFNVIIFPEGQNCIKKTHWRQLMEFRNGAFVMAKELNMPIVPIIITAGKYNNALVTYGKIEIHYLDMIDPMNYTIDEMKNHTYNLMFEKLQTVDS